jgi:hypothetical protein
MLPAAPKKKGPLSSFECYRGALARSDRGGPGLKLVALSLLEANATPLAQAWSSVCIRCCAAWIFPYLLRAAETALKEGLAQYYTDRVLHRLERRYGGALNTFRALLPNQAVVYRSHEAWIQNSSPEAVRRAILEVCRWKEGELGEFNRRLAMAHHDLG